MILHVNPSGGHVPCGAPLACARTAEPLWRRSAMRQGASGPRPTPGIPFPAEADPGLHSGTLSCRMASCTRHASRERDGGMDGGLPSDETHPEHSMHVVNQDLASHHCMYPSG